MFTFPPLLKQIYATMGTSFCFMTHGMILGLQSVMLPQLRTEKGGIKLDIDQESWIMSLTLISMFPSQLLCGYLTYKFGRKRIMVFMGIPMFTAIILMYFSYNYFTLAFAFLVFGIVGAGFSIGTMYIAEFTSPKYRNILLNFKTASIGIGIIIAHMMGCFYNWRDLVLYALIMALISIVTSVTSPESPAWLASKGKYNHCRKAFQWFRGEDEVDELEKLIERGKEIVESEESKGKQSKLEKIKNVFIMMTDRPFVKAMGICVACILFVDMSGKAVFGNYTIDTLTTVLGGPKYAYYAAVTMDFIDLVTSLISCITAHKLNVKKLMFRCGFTAIGILSLFCVTSYLFANNLMPIKHRWVTLVLIVVYFSLLNIGVVPTIFCLMNEVTPLSHREIGLSVTSFVFIIFLFTSIKITPYLIKYYDLHGTFLVNAVILSASLLYLYKFLPETQCKTLQDIEMEMKGKTDKGDGLVCPDTSETLLKPDA